MINDIILAAQAVTEGLKVIINLKRMDNVPEEGTEGLFTQNVEH